MAKNEKMFVVELAYAMSSQQYLIPVNAYAGETIRHVIERSQILKLCPEINLTTQRIGIFSKLAQLTDKVKAGDRVEIYRPLVIDPKEARRAKAKQALLNRT